MTIIIWTLSALAFLTFICYIAIPIARIIKNRGQQHDVAEAMYPGDKIGQSNFRDKVASDILKNNRGLKYESPEFKVLYQQEMDRLLTQYRSKTL
jgi:hypothetical protein